MSNLSRFKREFLATCPVIDPHGGIEAELLLAGIKPIGWYPIYNRSEAANGSFWQKKNFLDMENLDGAVAAGKLCSLEVTSETPSGIARNKFYCQPDQMGNMQRLAKSYQSVWQGGQADPEIDDGKLLGYRERDTKYFYWSCEQNLPEFTDPILSKFNHAVSQANMEHLLEQCGIDDPDRYWDEVEEQVNAFYATPT